jgi:hypothetical protein
MQQEAREDPRLIDIPPYIDLIVIAFLTTIPFLRFKLKVAFIIVLMETIIIVSVFQNIPINVFIYVYIYSYTYTHTHTHTHTKQ